MIRFLKARCTQPQAFARAFYNYETNTVDPATRSERVDCAFLCSLNRLCVLMLYLRKAVKVGKIDGEPQRVWGPIIRDFSNWCPQALKTVTLRAWGYPKKYFFCIFSSHKPVGKLLKLCNTSSKIKIKSEFSKLHAPQGGAHNRGRASYRNCMEWKGSFSTRTPPHFDKGEAAEEHSRAPDA